MPDQNRSQEPPPPPEPRYRFRWEVFVGIPLAIAAVFFVLKGIEPSFQFADVMEKLNIINQNRYVRLACLCVVGVAILLMVKLFRNHSD
jgi:hypothetical protein